MKEPRRQMVCFLNNESGAEVAEVGIWLALIVAGAVALIAALGGSIATTFSTISAAVTAAV